MDKNIQISKKLRFEVFKRDGFKCQYCGKTPPETTLEVDHIKPKSKSGTNDINNLITSCFDCNRGKSNIELKKIPNSLQENKDILIERENQYVEYHKILAKIDRRSRKEIEDINNIYSSYFTGYELTENFKINTVKKFISKLNYFSVSDAMKIACCKFNNTETVRNGRNWEYSRDAALKYFCGICWNKIKEVNNG